MPHLGPYVDDVRSWELRRSLYRDILGRPDSRLILAGQGWELIGYALGYLLSGDERGWLDDTWATTGKVGEIESLSVLPSYRGRGVGGRLLDLLCQELRTAGASSLVIGVLPENQAAINLYADRGFAPTWTYLSRLAGREVGGGRPDHKAT